MESRAWHCVWVWIGLVVIQIQEVISYSCAFGCQRGQYCCKTNECCDVIEGMTPAVWTGISTGCSLLFILIVVCICVCVCRRRRAMQNQQTALPMTVPTSSTGVVYSNTAPAGKTPLSTIGYGQNPAYTEQPGQATSQQYMMSYPIYPPPYTVQPSLQTHDNQQTVNNGSHTTPSNKHKMAL